MASSPYLTDSDNIGLSLDPPSPPNLGYSSDLHSPSFSHTPSYNGSYNNSPFSAHSELSFGDDDPSSFGLFPPTAGVTDTYDPSEYDTSTGGLLMFADSLTAYDNTLMYADYSSPSDNGDGQRSRASSVSSQQHQPQNQQHLSPRMDMTNSFENMNFHSPNWGTDPLPSLDPSAHATLHHNPSIHQRSVSPHQQPQKPQSPPRLLMPDEPSSPNPDHLQPPVINAPDGDDPSGGGPNLRIIPATPVSGGGASSDGVMPFQHHAGEQFLGAPQQHHQSQASSSQQKYTFPSNREPSPGPSNSSPFLFPHAPRSRSKSDTSLSGSPVALWNPAPFGRDDSAIADDATVSMNDISPSQQQHQMSSQQFLTPEGFNLNFQNANLRRTKSERMGSHIRGSRSEDMRPSSGMGGLLTVPGMGMDQAQWQQQYLSPQEPPPPIRGNISFPQAVPFHPGHARRTSTGSNRSERGTGATWGVPGASSDFDPGRQRPSPYPSPNASPRVRYDDLPVSTDPLEGLQQTPASMIVSKPNVTTNRTAKASHNRRKQEATFICPVPGCGSTFTRSFNLKGHIRSHNEEKPFLCHWPGCGKGFARQHDCKRHEQLHTNYRPFTCDGCSKPFARMDALNRHLRSEGGSECQRILEQSGNLPTGAPSPPGGGGGGGGGKRKSKQQQQLQLQDSLPIPIRSVDVSMPESWGGGMGIGKMEQGDNAWGVPTMGGGGLGVTL